MQICLDSTKAISPGDILLRDLGRSRVAARFSTVHGSLVTQDLHDNISKLSSISSYPNSSRSSPLILPDDVSNISHISRALERKFCSVHYHISRTGYRSHSNKCGICGSQCGRHRQEDSTNLGGLIGQS